MTMAKQYHSPRPERQIFCNRTLNLRSIRVIGYDMDYTLIHYHANAWERRAYEHVQAKLLEMGWPVQDLKYIKDFIVRGLIIDTEYGNIVKANRFGYVKRAYHGTKPIPYEDQRKLYSSEVVDLREERWVFLNTLFSLSEGCMFAQLVDKLDAGEIEDAIGYVDLMRIVHKKLDQTHAEGTLKQDILNDPDKYIVHDPEAPLALLDQRQSGKKVVLITNSEWEYTREVMKVAFDPHLPEGKTWRDLFNIIIVAARKPSFFMDKNPVFEVVDESGLLKPVVGHVHEGGIYLGGNAMMLEKLWDLSGDEFLYVGDHIFADVNVSKSALRWRTGLILREMEAELSAIAGYNEDQRAISILMEKKQELEYQENRLRLELLRIRKGYGERSGKSAKELEMTLEDYRNQLQALDQQISPLARASSELLNRHWGMLMRAGNDKSHLARQVENYADIYMSRVSNFLCATPFVYLRAARSTLPHDSVGVQMGVDREEQE